MTCIVGLKQNDRVWLGADSSVVNEDSSGVYHWKKVFRKDEFVFAFAGSFRFGQLLQHTFSVSSAYDNDLWDSEYLCTSVASSVSSLVESHNLGDDDAWEILFAWKNCLYIMSDDYAIFPCEPYTAAGSGSDFALGSLYTSTGVPDPETRIRKALAAASMFSSLVNPPFHILRCPQ